MVTRPKPQPLYLKEWRKFMGVKATVLADALDIERESYYRLERETFRISVPELVALAETIGVKVSQLWWPPPKPGADIPMSLDSLIEDQSPEKRTAALWAVRGIVGK